MDQTHTAMLQEAGEFELRCSYKAYEAIGLNAVPIFLSQRIKDVDWTNT